MPVSNVLASYFTQIFPDLACRKKTWNATKEFFCQIVDNFYFQFFFRSRSLLERASFFFIRKVVLAQKKSTAV